MLPPPPWLPTGAFSACGQAFSPASPGLPVCMRTLVSQRHREQGPHLHLSLSASTAAGMPCPPAHATGRTQRLCTGAPRVQTHSLTDGLRPPGGHACGLGPRSLPTNPETWGNCRASGVHICEMGWDTYLTGLL